MTLKIASIPAGTDVYAIGDVHGRADLLAPLINSIETRCVKPVFVFLGDLVDRGPSSRSAVELALSTIERHPGSAIVMGNHEEFVLEFIQSRNPWDFWDDWKYEGGLKTVLSFGIDATMPANDIAAYLKSDPLLVRLFQTVVDVAEDDARIYAHAGIRPNVPLEQQRADVLRWIREPFLDSRADHGRIVIHGHTITDSELPEQRYNRIAIDTGAFATGKLTAARFSPSGETEFIMSSESAGKSVISVVEPLELS
jgi:serine/threonine protein phosphatase 1